MAKVASGRMSARLTGDEAGGGFVVFRIGMGVNHWWKPWQWVPVLRTMPRMLRELSVERERGMLAYDMAFGRGGPVITQWWVDTAHLIAYASAADGEHLPAWRAFRSRAAASGGAVGFWHETYQVHNAEAVYGDMPRIGMAAAGEHVRVEDVGHTAKRRLASSAHDGEYEKSA